VDAGANTETLMAQTISEPIVTEEIQTEKVPF